MSWETLVWAKAQRTGSVGCKAVLMAMAEYADERHSCFPSQETLAEDTEQSIRTVRTHIATLVDKGLIEVERSRAPDGARTTNRYHLLLPEVNLASGARRVTGGTRGNGLPPEHQRERSQEPETSAVASGSHASAPPPARRGTPNPVWDAVVEVCRLDTSSMTESEKKHMGGIVKQLKQVEALPDEIRAFSTWWTRTYPGARLTPPTITKHWSAFRTAATSGGERYDPHAYMFQGF